MESTVPTPKTTPSPSIKKRVMPKTITRINDQLRRRRLAGRAHTSLFRRKLALSNVRRITQRGGVLRKEASVATVIDNIGNNKIFQILEAAAILTIGQKRRVIDKRSLKKAIAYLTNERLYSN